MASEELREFDKECRQLWRSVAIAYATDGNYPDKMEKWANKAVDAYERRFKSDIVNKQIAKDTNIGGYHA